MPRGKKKVASDSAEAQKPKASKAKEYETKEVTSVSEGDKLQKDGWEFVSAVKIGTTEEGLTLKKFTFRKEK